MLGTYCEGNALLSWVHHCARPPKVCDAAASSCGHVFILIWLSSAPDSTASLSLIQYPSLLSSLSYTLHLSLFLSLSLYFFSSHLSFIFHFYSFIIFDLCLLFVAFSFQKMVVEMSLFTRNVQHIGHCQLHFRPAPWNSFVVGGEDSYWSKW